MEDYQGSIRDKHHSLPVDDDGTSSSLNAEMLREHDRRIAEEEVSLQSLTLEDEEGSDRDRSAGRRGITPRSILAEELHQDQKKALSTEATKSRLQKLRERRSIRERSMMDDEVKDEIVGKPKREQSPVLSESNSIEGDEKRRSENVKRKDSSNHSRSTTDRVGEKEQDNDRKNTTPRSTDVPLKKDRNSPTAEDASEGDDEYVVQIHDAALLADSCATSSPSSTSSSASSVLSEGNGSYEGDAVADHAEVQGERDNGNDDDQSNTEDDDESSIQHRMKQEERRKRWSAGTDNMLGRARSKVEEQPEPRASSALSSKSVGDSSGHTPRRSKEEVRERLAERRYRRRSSQDSDGSHGRRGRRGSRESDRGRRSNRTNSHVTAETAVVGDEEDDEYYGGDMHQKYLKYRRSRNSSADDEHLKMTSTTSGSSSTSRAAARVAAKRKSRDEEKDLYYVDDDEEEDELDTPVPDRYQRGRGVDRGDDRRSGDDNAEARDRMDQNCCFIKVFCCDCTRTCWIIWFTLLGLGMTALIAAFVGIHLRDKYRANNAPTIQSTMDPTKSPSSNSTEHARQGSLQNEIVRLMQDVIPPDEYEALLLSSDPTTPQYEAFDWILHEDMQRLSISEGMNNSARLAQRYSLAVLYFSTNMQYIKEGQRTPETVLVSPSSRLLLDKKAQMINSTSSNLNEVTGLGSPTNSSMLGNWLSAQHECLWEGIVCDPPYVPSNSSISPFHEDNTTSIKNSTTQVTVFDADPADFLPTTDKSSNAMLSGDGIHELGADATTGKKRKHDLDEMRVGTARENKYLRHSPYETRRALRDRKKEELEEKTNGTEQYEAAAVDADKKAHNPFPMGQGNSDSRVIALDLSDRGISGVIPVELWLLSRHLKHLDLSMNNFTYLDWRGQPLMELLPSLEKLRLNDNPDLTGTLNLTSSPLNYSVHHATPLAWAQIDVRNTDVSVNVGDAYNATSVTQQASWNMSCFLLDKSILLMDEEEVEKELTELANLTMTEYCQSVVHSDSYFVEQDEIGHAPNMVETLIATMVPSTLLEESINETVKENATDPTFGGTIIYMKPNGNLSDAFDTTFEPLLDVNLYGIPLECTEPLLMDSTSKNNDTATLPNQNDACSIRILDDPATTCNHVTAMYSVYEQGNDDSEDQQTAEWLDAMALHSSHEQDENETGDELTVDWLMDTLKNTHTSMDDAYGSLLSGQQYFFLAEVNDAEGVDALVTSLKSTIAVDSLSPPLKEGQTVIVYDHLGLPMFCGSLEKGRRGIIFS